MASAANELFKDVPEFHKGELSHLEVCRELGWNPWEFLGNLKAGNLHLNVDLEDWLDSEQMNRGK